MSEKGVCDDEYAGNFHHIDYYIIEGRDLTQNNWISLRFRTFVCYLGGNGLIDDDHLRLLLSDDMDIGVTNLVLNHDLFSEQDDQGRVRSCAGDVYESIAHGVDDSGVSVMAYGNVIDERNGMNVAIANNILSALL